MQYFQRYINFKCGEKTEGKKKRKKGGGGGGVTNDKLSVMSNKMKTYSSPRWISCWWIWGSSIGCTSSLFFPLKKEKEKRKIFFYNVQNTEMLWTWRLLLLIWCVKMTFFITPPPPPPFVYVCMCVGMSIYFYFYKQRQLLLYVPCYMISFCTTFNSSSNSQGYQQEPSTST